MKISEIFCSIQGEGRLAGVVSVFVRIAGCDLRCVWCDTKYAWDSEDAERMSVADVVERVCKYDCRYVVVTGGEPLLDDALEELLDQLHQRGKHITVETSGRRYVKMVCDLVSISPKLSNSLGNSAGVAIEEQLCDVDVIRRYIEGYNCQLKFVVSSESDLAEVEDVLSQLDTVAREDVMLMPMAATQQEYRLCGQQVAQWCIERGFRFGPRLHIEFWGCKRGW